MKSVLYFTKSVDIIDEKMGEKENGLMLVLSGPSGVGKDVMARRIVSCVPGSTMIRTYTNRAQRPGEPDDAYHHISKEEFEE